MPTEKICSLSEIPPGSVKEFKFQNYDIAIFNVEGKFYAIDRKCTHMKGNLAKGTVEGKIVTCPLHGAKYNLATGELLKQAGSIAGWFKKATNIPTYKTKTQKNDLFVEFPDE
ncbi:MAG: Rieske (2Fe-2S) protein [Candidatus Thorarchaeota archaeon]